jgi:hypothetical protein
LRPVIPKLCNGYLYHSDGALLRSMLITAGKLPKQT